MLNWFGNLGIRPKLMLSFSIVLAFLAIIVVANFVLGRRTSETTSSVLDHVVPAKLAAQDIAGKRIAHMKTTTPDPRSTNCV